MTQATVISSPSHARGAATPIALAVHDASAVATGKLPATMIARQASVATLLHMYVYPTAFVS